MATRLLTRRCASCALPWPLKLFARHDGALDVRCRACRRRDAIGPPALTAAPSNVVDLLEAKMARRRFRN